MWKQFLVLEECDNFRLVVLMTLSEVMTYTFKTTLLCIQALI